MPIDNKTWVTGEVITADDLNLITPLVVEITKNSDPEVWVASKTFKQIIDAFKAGRNVICVAIRTSNLMNAYEMYHCKVTEPAQGIEEDYQMELLTDESPFNNLSFVGVTEDDYPTGETIG